MKKFKPDRIRTLNPAPKRRLRVNAPSYDTDGDGVPDWRDCNPYNPNEQGWIHDRLKGTKEYVSKRYSEYTEDREAIRQLEREEKRKAYEEYIKEKTRLEKEEKLREAREKARLKATRKTIYKKKAKKILGNIGDEERRREQRGYGYAKPKTTSSFSPAPSFSPFSMSTTSRKKKPMGKGYFSILK